MDKMREEFEMAYVMHVCGCDAERAAKRIIEMDGEGPLAKHSEVYDYKYCQQSTNDAWWAWKASRAALCVELPSGLTEKQFTKIAEQIENFGGEWK
ncbi:MAG: hypothetical protein ACRCXB_31265 [Aeromonadaceae bacterium]